MGISILWVSGVEFPVHPSPGPSSCPSAHCSWPFSSSRWSIAVGAFLGVFVLVGFVTSTVVSGTGAELLSGEDGAGGVIGTLVQLAGVTPRDNRRSPSASAANSRSEPRPDDKTGRRDLGTLKVQPASRCLGSPNHSKTSLSNVTISATRPPSVRSTSIAKAS